MIVLACLAFFFVNYLIYLVLKLVVGRGLFAIVAIGLAYYFLVRKVVTYLIFPGSFCIYRRRLEVQY